MSATEEVQEHAHEAREPFDKAVAASMAIIAAMLAVVSVLGQHFTTEELLAQAKASDQWAYYQAKNIRRYSAQIAQDTLGQIKAEPKVVSRYVQDVDKEQHGMRELYDEATNLGTESKLRGRQAGRFHFGEVFLELAIVLSSLAILTKRRPFFFAGLASGAVGVVMALSVFQV